MAKHLGATDLEHEGLAQDERVNAEAAFQASAYFSQRGKCNRALEALSKGYGHVGSAVSHDVSGGGFKPSLVGHIADVAKDKFRDFCMPSRKDVKKMQKASKKTRRRRRR